MASEAERSARVFKTAWFSRAARKTGIAEGELCAAILQAIRGLAVDLGGVYKKRLDKNRSRSIILAKGRQYWVYAYLFAKKDRPNISDRELRNFRALADLYAKKTDVEIAKELQMGELAEICR
jgi:hypothetical protein